MNYEEAMAYLSEISSRGNRLGLDSIRVLLEELGNPQDDLTFVHIAGTNGKGSVMSYLGKILEEAGYRVGRYVSPAVFGYEECIQINGQWIEKEDVARLTGVIADARKKISARGDLQATIFEVETVMSFLYFREKKCDLVLQETGMGGREDATNVVTTSILELFSSISMDHMKFLGDTPEEIAYAKSGIIKPGTVVVSDCQKAGVEQVLQNVCREQDTAFYSLDPQDITNIHYGLKEQTFDYRELSGLCIRMAGTCQVNNAALAVEASLKLNDMGYLISENHIRKGLEKTFWPGRFQIMNEQPFVIIDGAHNPAAANALMNALDIYFPKNKIYYIFGVFSDKEYDKIIDITAQRATKIYTVETKNNPRALPARALTEAVENHTAHVVTAGDVGTALDLALTETRRDDVILVFGSLSFLWEVERYFFRGNADQHFLRKASD